MSEVESRGGDEASEASGSFSRVTEQRTLAWKHASKSAQRPSFATTARVTPPTPPPPQGHASLSFSGALHSWQLPLLRSLAQARLRTLQRVHNRGAGSVLLCQQCLAKFTMGCKAGVGQERVRGAWPKIGTMRNAAAFEMGAQQKSSPRVFKFTSAASF